MPSRCACKRRSPQFSERNDDKRFFVHRAHGCPCPDTNLAPRPAVRPASERPRASALAIRRHPSGRRQYPQSHALGRKSKRQQARIRHVGQPRPHNGLVSRSNGGTAHNRWPPTLSRQCIKGLDDSPCRVGARRQYDWPDEDVSVRPDRPINPIGRRIPLPDIMRGSGSARCRPFRLPVFKRRPKCSPPARSAVHSSARRLDRLIPELPHTQDPRYKPVERSALGELFAMKRPLKVAKTPPLRQQSPRWLIQPQTAIIATRPRSSAG